MILSKYTIKFYIKEDIMFIIGVIFLLVGILLCFFKADWLIAGYNVLSEDEKRKKGYNMSLFMKICGIGLIIISLIFFAIYFLL